MPSIFDRAMSYVYRKQAEGAEKPDDFDLLDKEGSEDGEDKEAKGASASAQKCDVCGRGLNVGLLSSTVGGKCRICQRLCCSEHFHDSLCPFCREKLGKTQPLQKDQHRPAF